MRVTFLGTAAAEGIPALWCECDHCRKAAMTGGKDRRRRTCYLVDADTMVDFGPDIHWQCAEFHVDPTGLKRILFTHPHSDHLNPAEFLWRGEAGLTRISHPVTVIGTQPVFDELLRGEGKQLSPADLSLVPLLATPGKWQSDGDLEFLPLPAAHAPGKEAVIYLLRRNGKTLLIANDTGPLPEETWSRLSGIRLDAAVIECALGLAWPDGGSSHLGCNLVLSVRRRLLEENCLAPTTPVFVTHLVHCGGSHDELTRFFQPHGIEVAYDGLVLNLE